MANSKMAKILDHPAPDKIAKKDITPPSMKQTNPARGSMTAPPSNNKRTEMTMRTLVPEPLFDICWALTIYRDSTCWFGSINSSE